jgi:hypothetical protein
MKRYIMETIPNYEHGYLSVQYKKAYFSSAAKQSDFS